MTRSTTGAAIATSCGLVAMVLARLPQRLLDGAGIESWMVALVVVVAFVNGARSIVRAPFTFAARTASAAVWAASEAKLLVVSVAAGSALTIPLYALLRSTPNWWLLAWLLFLGVTVVGQFAMPLLLRSQAGPIEPADAALTARVTELGARANVAVGAVQVARGGKGKHCNAYVVGLGPTRRVVLGAAIADWPADVADQVVAHEIGHWRLGHTARRMPLTAVAQLATFGFAAAVLAWGPLLRWAGVPTIGDPRSYPALLLLTAALALPAKCLMAWLDRRQERAADEFALTLLHQPERFAAMLDRAAEEGQAPRRLPWFQRMIASHPPIDERITACMRYASTA